MLQEDVNAVGTLVALPIGELFRSLALGLADAQTRLDESSMTVAELMSGTKVTPDGTTRDSRVFFGYHLEQEGEKIRRVPDRLSMLELGFVPNFYQFVDTVIEVKVAMSVSRVATATSGPAGGGQTGNGSGATSAAGAGGNGGDRMSSAPTYAITTTPVDASYSSSYNFKAEFSSVLKTKLVPIPPPALLEDRIRQMVGLPRTEAASAAEDSASATADGTKTQAIQDKGRSQISKVEVFVGKGATRRLGLDIRLKGKFESLIPPGKTTEIETISGKSTRTAEILAAKLNEAVPHLLAATARGRWVTLQFHDTRDYEIVQHPGGGRANRFDVKEPPTVKARSPGGK